MAHKLLLIDANSLIHRAFHALPHLSTADGQATNAAFGLAQMLLALLEEQAPDEAVMVFDAPGPTFRHEMYDQYKANRPEMDQELASQFPIIRRLVQAMGLVMLEQAGYEADDLIGALAARAHNEGYETVIVSGDRDLLQLLDEGVQVLITTRGTKQVTAYDVDKFTEQYGITPAQLVDLKALAGDTSDNIPGITGIGDKTASGLLAEYGTVEAVLEHTADLPEAVRSKLAGNEQEALLWKRLASIQCDVPLEQQADDLAWRGLDGEALRKLLAELEFTSLLKRLPASQASTTEGTVAAADADSLAGICDRAEQAGALFVVPTAHGDAEALALAAGPDLAVSLLLPSASAADTQQAGLFADADQDSPLPEALVQVLGDPQLAISGCRLKDLDNSLRRREVGVRNLAFDAEIASYLLAPQRSDHGIGVWAAQYLGWDLPETDAADAYGMPAWQARGCIEALATAQLQARLQRDLKQQGMLELFTDVEMPLVSLLAKMERAGIGVDRERLQEAGRELSRMMQELSARIFELAGEEFNLDSPKQVGEVLFERLELPKGRKTKTGWSTAASVLEDLAHEHEIVALILEYREYAKLRSTYVDGLERQIDPATGLIHTSFEQTVTATGRLSSRSPNLQNIPIRTEWGRQIRSCFCSGVAGYSFICADYSQIELRILAHLSQDPTLLEAFANHEDIHTYTATLIFDCGRDEVDYRMRSAAKTVNYAVLYGMGPRALADALDMSLQEAREFIESYHQRLPKVQELLSATLEQARQTGYVSTIMGRRRPVPDLDAANARARSYAERAATNTPMQGSAADLVKLAMLKLDAALQADFPEAEMLLQVHDEIVLRAPAESVPDLAGLVKEVMESAYPLSVPLTVDVSVGDNWRDVQPLQE